jgi:hypothetical protein
MHRTVLLLIAAACTGDAPTDTPDDDTSVPEPTVLPLEVTVDAVPFGEVPVGCVVHQPATVFNPNDTEVTVESVRIEGVHGDAFGTLGRWSSDLDLVGGGQEDFDLRFLADALGTYDDARIVFTTDPPGAAPAPIPLSGVASDDPRFEATHVQADPRDPDVLIVHGVASRIEGYMNTISQRVGRLVSEFDERGVDYRIAVLTTESDEPLPGAFRGMVDPQTPDAAVALASLLLEPSYFWSTPDERMFEAIQAALSPPVLQNGTNDGFLRPAASLHVVLTNDRDTSHLDRVSASEIGDFLRGLKEDHGDAQYHLLADGDRGPGPDCGYDATYGLADELHAVRAHLPSTHHLICDLATDYYFAMVAEAAMGLDGRYPLDDRLAGTSCDDIDVYVDGAWIPCNGWEVSEGAYLRLLPGFSATPGSEVRVRVSGGDVCDSYDDPVSR